MSNGPLKRSLIIAVTGAALGLFLASSAVHAKGPAVPRKGSAAAGLLAGLKAIHADAKDDFVNNHCSKKKLCSSPDAIKRMYRFNWPSAKRMMPKCLKGAKLDQITVTQVRGDEAKDSEVKVFISCIEGQRPRPYRMHKEGGSWKLANVF